MATGRKTYNGAINWANDGEPMIGRSIAEIAKAKDKAAGVVTTVSWCDATPACFGGAHNIKRDNRVQIANEMLNARWLDVIMGAGNPDFDNDGRPNKHPDKDDYAYVGGKIVWNMLEEGRHPSGWKLIQTKEEFEKVADGSVMAPRKLLGVPQTAATVRVKRSYTPLPPGEKNRQREPYGNSV